MSETNGSGATITPFAAGHALGVASLCSDLGWESYADAEVVGRSFSAPGVVAYVASDGEAVVGFAQAFGDGVVQSYLANLAVAESHRRHGTARSLVAAVFAATGTTRMDVLTDDAAAFYQSFPHRDKTGLRIYPPTEATPSEPLRRAGAAPRAGGRARAARRQ